MMQPRAQGRHAGLTREQVVTAAVELVDRDGAAALSMRRLARELGVEAMTLYHHVGSKEGLEDAVVEHVLTQALARPDAAAPWPEVLTGLATALHRGLVAHPGSVSLFATRPAVTPGTAAELESVLAVLADAGFAPNTALRIVHALAGSVIGQHLASAREDELDSAVEEALGGTPGTRVRAATEAGAPSVDERVDLAVEALVAGLEVLLASGRLADSAEGGAGGSVAG